MDVIPAIDVIGGRCVRLYQGDFDRVTEYADDPVELARRYSDAGLRRLHLVDLDGARTGTQVNHGLIADLAGLGVEVQIGGGIRSAATVRALLDAGAARAVIGSVAVGEPDTVAGWIEAYGAERIVLAFDVRVRADGTPLAATHGWTRDSAVTLWELLDTYTGAGARHVLCTDIAKDGTLAGPNVDLYRACTDRFPDLAFIASGGVSAAADLAPLAATGVAGVVTGKALLDGRLTLEEIRQFLQDA